jgi:hypothetical protein
MLSVFLRQISQRVNFEYLVVLVVLLLALAFLLALVRLLESLLLENQGEQGTVAQPMEPQQEELVALEQMFLRLHLQVPVPFGVP